MHFSRVQCLYARGYMIGKPTQVVRLQITLEFSDFGIGDVGINDVEEISEFFTISNKADLRNDVSI